jgi:hypothetical protein
MLRAGGGTGTAHANLHGVGRNDTFAGGGTLVVAGVLTILESRDVFAGSALITGGTLTALEQHDTFAASGTCIVASLAASERRDTLAAPGVFFAPGSAALAERRDSFAAAGRSTASGTIAAVGGNDAFAGTAAVKFTGSAALPGGSDIFAGAAAPGSPASLAAIENRDIFAGRGGPVVTAALAATEQHDTFAGSSGATRAVLAAAERHDTFAGFDTGLEYQIYSNSGVGDPIDYTTAIATTATLCWTTAPLAAPGVWRFGVRAYSTVSGLEEENLDAAVTIVLDAAGNDISNQPKAPTALRAIARQGGTIRVEWAYNTVNPSPVPTGFHLYSGTGGTPNYSSIVATVAFTAAIGGGYFSDVTGLTDGTAYTFGVRAYNGTAEETNTLTATTTADATGPAAVVDLTSTAIV